MIEAGTNAAAEGGTRATGAAAPEAPPRRPYPSKLFVEITTRCNLDCAMCVKQSTDGLIVEGDMTLQTFERLEPAFARLEALVLNGIGEPLLHRDLTTFIARARSAMPSDGWIGFQTNGQLIGPRRADALVAAGADRICISADSVAPEHLAAIHGGARIGPIDAAAARLRDSAKRAGRRLSLGLQFVALRDNLHELPMLLEWAAARRFDFVIVTQMLAYDAAMSSKSAFAPTTDRALAIYRTWRDRAEAAGVDLWLYIESFKHFDRSESDEAAIRFARAMIDDATAQGISLRVADLLTFDERRAADVEATFAEAAELAARLGIELQLPAAVPTAVRRCEFVEDGSMFVSWTGDVHPCYFLWHRFDCFLGGIRKPVWPEVFGNVNEADVLSIWRNGRFAQFRDNVTRYDFPFCYDCNLAMCDYMIDPEFEQDCHVTQVPCAGCLWCTGPFQCLR